jgi:hypothetical protein
MTGLDTRYVTGDWLRAALFGEMGSADRRRKT